KSVTAIFVLRTTSVSRVRAKNLIDGSMDVLVIDVSSASEYAADHMLCAKNYAWNSGENNFDSTNLIPYKEDDILIYDQTGANSEAAAEYLAVQGFESVYYMADGLNDWIDEGYGTFTTAEDDEKCTSLLPMAYAGKDQTDDKSVDEKQPVTLDGYASSSGVTYAWLQVGGVNDVTLSDPAALKPVFTAPDLNSGDDTLIFQLTVTDDEGKTDTDRVRVYVNWNNGEPTADAGPDQTVSPGATVILDGSASTDPEDSIVSYQWNISGAMGSFPLSLTGQTPSFTAPNADEWVIYRLTVTDNGGKTDTDKVTITINADNNKIDGDVNGDSNVDLSDAILALQLMVGINPAQPIYKTADVNDDGQIGLEEAIRALQAVSGIE
ncbi:MAG: hypothetical protein J7K96_08690, partial [Desulfobacteraceae bacterium]|nr:hypothetical protein [Desulfobacteraceae bacterium]